MSSRAPNGVMRDTVKLCGPGCLDGSRKPANWRRPKAVSTEMMLVSWEKSRYMLWFRGNVTVLLSSVTLICEPEYPSV